jgi:hypothetical protein
MRTLLPFLSLLLAAPAIAGQIPEQQWAAVQAADVHSQYCAEGVDQTIGSAGSAMVKVAEVWASLDGMPERTGATGLLYWRGLLAECLNRPEHAIRDLSAFLELHQHDATWVEPAQDAIRRLRRMGVAVEAGPSKPPVGRIVGVAVGGLQGVGAGVLGALAGVRAGHLNELRSTYTSGSLTTDDFAIVDAQGVDAARDVNGFAAGAAGFTVGALTTVLISALAPDSGAGTVHRVALVAVPTPDGAVIALGGRW